MISKPVFLHGALQARISSALYHLGKFDPRDTNRRQLHGDLVGSIVQGPLIDKRETFDGDQHPAE